MSKNKDNKKETNFLLIIIIILIIMVVVTFISFSILFISYINKTLEEKLENYAYYSLNNVVEYSKYKQLIDYYEEFDINLLFLSFYS